MAQLLFHHFGHLGARRAAVGAGVEQVQDGFGHLAAVDVHQLRDVLDPQHEAAAELARFGQRFVELRYLLQAGNLIADEPHAPVAVLPHALQQQGGQRQPHGYQRAHRLAVAGCGGDKQPAAVVLRVGHPLSDAELRFALFIQPLQVAQRLGVVGQHRADGDGGFLDFFLDQVGRRGVFEKLAQAFQVDREAGLQERLDAAIGA